MQLLGDDGGKSTPSSPSHHQIVVSLRYSKCRGAWVFRCDAILFFVNPPLSGLGIIEHYNLISPAWLIAKQSWLGSLICLVTLKLYCSLGSFQRSLREGLTKQNKKKTSDFVWTGGGGSENYPLCLNPISEFLILLVSINLISTWLNFNFVFSSMVCFGLLAWSKMYKYHHPKLSGNLGFCSNIPVVYNWTLPFWKCWSNIKMHFLLYYSI